MRYKTLMALAVAGAVGWSVNTLAGSGYEVSTPSAANETGPVMTSNASSHSGWMSSTEAPIVLSLSESSYSVINNGYAEDSAVGATADSGSGSLSGSVASDEYASLADEDALALADEGIYSDFYRVTYTPIALSDWDYYVLDDGWVSYALVTPGVVETITLALNDSYDAGDGAVTQVFDDGSILQVFDDGSMLAIDDSAESMVVVA
jgi:hypothetical protein